MAVHQFAVVVDGDVVTVLAVDTDGHDPEGSAHRIIAGLSSDPKIIDITGTEGIDYGWTWDGEIFLPPMKEPND